MKYFMSKKSLPLTLYKTLEKHVQELDINDDEELQEILEKLEDLGTKVEELKQRAFEKRVEKSKIVVNLKPQK